MLNLVLSLAGIFALIVIVGRLLHRYFIYLPDRARVAPQEAGLLGVEEESRRDRARRAGALLADLAELGSEISEVYVEPSGDLRLVLRGAGEVLAAGGRPSR